MKDRSGSPAEGSPADVYLVDGSALAYRSFFAFQGRPLRTSAGVETSAVYGFILTLINLLKRRPARIAVVFDLPGPTFRHEKFPAYKANRPPTPPSLVDQLGPIREVVEAFGIPLLEREGFEADDIIATLTREARGRGLGTVIVSADKDLLQLIGPGVSALVPASGSKPEVVLDRGGVREKMGVEPGQVADLLGLMGDASDNIPGVRGIGAKTAAKLIGEFGSLEGVYRNLDSVKPDRTRRALEEHRQDALLSLELVRLRTDLPLGISMDELRPRGPDLARLEALFREFEFSRLLMQVVPEEEAEPDLPPGQADGAGPEEQAQRLSLAESVAVEVEIPEGGGRTPRAFHLCSPGGDALSVEVERGAAGLGGDVRSLLEDRGPGIWTWSSKNLRKSLAALGLELKEVEFDVELAAYLLNPGRPRELAVLCAQYLGRLPAGLRAPAAQGTLGLAPGGSSADGGASDAAAHARAVCALVPVLRPLLEDQHLTPLYREIELPLAEVLASMESTGVNLQSDLLRRMGGELGEEIVRIEEDVYRQVGERFNLASPQQLKRVLFDVLGLAPGRRTKTGFSTDSSVLENLAKDHEVPRLVLQHRQLSKLKSTYLDALPGMVDPATGRIHTTFHQTVTATGRLSSSDPNLQNIPMRTDLGRELRKAFVSSGPDWRIYSADYSQIELRIVAHMAADAGLMEAFRRGEDIHRATAAAVAGIDPESVTPAARDRAKAVNFGILYGMGPRALAASAGMEFSEARAFIERYFETYPGVRAFIERTVEEARSRGYVTTLFDRRRYLPELESQNPRDRAFGERTAVNTRVQGTAADIIKKAMVVIFRRMKRENLRSRMILQVHDELVFDGHADEMDRLEAIVTGEMAAAAPLDVPVIVTGGVGMNWYEAH